VTADWKKARNTIRIVPLHVAGDAEHPTPEALAGAPAVAPNLTYRGGPLLTSVKVFTIFWGSAWTGAQAALVTKGNAFFDYVLTSPLIDQLSEYSVPGQTIGHGSRIGSTTVTTPRPARSVTDAELQTFLKNEIAKQQVPPEAGRQHALFHLRSSRRTRSSRRLGVVQGLLWLSQRHWRKHHLRHHAVSRLRRLSGDPQSSGRADHDEFS
jgi:hypothetical protein